MAPTGAREGGRTPARQRIPVCLIIDDGALFKPSGPGEVPAAFFRRLGEWAKASGVRGKFSVIPIYHGIAAIDGSLGEYPGHTKAERLAFIRMIRELYEPNWTITPEVITHGAPWDIERNKPLVTDLRENQYLATLPPDKLAEYIAFALRKLQNVDITCGGLTMCWTYPYEKNEVLGRAVSEAMARVYGPGNAMLFNDLNTKPRVVHRAADGHVVTTTPTNVDDLPSAGASPESTEEQMAAAVDSYISPDGKSGKYIEAMERDGHLIILTHLQTIYSAGTEKGLTVLMRAVERLNKSHGDRIRWMTGLETANRFAGK